MEKTDAPKRTTVNDTVRINAEDSKYTPVLDMASTNALSMLISSY